MAFTKLYLHNVAAAYTPPTKRGAWDLTTSAATKRLNPSKMDGGAFTTVGFNETSGVANYDVMLYRGVSHALSAQTISGDLNCVIGLLESDAGQNAHFHLHVFVTAGDTDTVRGTLVTDYTEAAGTNEWPTTATGTALNAAVTMSSLAISAGDRIVVEIGYVSRNSVATGYTGTLNYGTIPSNTNDPANDLTAGSTNVTRLAGYISFSNEISEPDVAGRVAQEVVEAITTATSIPAVDQVVVEAVTTATSIPAVDQVVVESITTKASNALLSQMVVEYVAANNVDDNIAQVVVEVMLRNASASEELAQLVVEVLVTAPAMASERSYVWMGDGGGAVWIE